MIRATYTDKQFDKAMQDALLRAEQAYIDGLIEIGIAFVADAKANGQYENDTGNLRSSIGYIVAKGRKVLSSSFKVVAGGNKGRSKGYFLAKSLLANNPDKLIRLIVVAGMDYASILESKGRDVLTGSSLRATSNLRQLAERVRNGN